MIEKYIENYRRQRSWQKLATVLAAVVVFCTTYALILPAITWEKQLICEQPEHVHTDACYEEIDLSEIAELATDSEEYGKIVFATDSNAATAKVLVCEIPEHTHTEACFDAPPAEKAQWLCGMEQHIHDESCYFEDGSLKCTLQEHVHTEECDCIIMDDVTGDDSMPIEIQCTESDGKYILTADIPESKTEDYIWQWQESEDGEDPWYDIERATGFKYEILKEDVTDDIWIRVKGIRKGEISEINREEGWENEIAEAASPSEASISEATVSEAIKSKAEETQIQEHKLMKVPMLIAAEPESEESSELTSEEDALLSEPVMLLGAGAATVYWEKVTDLGTLSPSDTVVIISENTTGGNRAFTLQHKEYDNDQLVGSAEANVITSVGDNMYTISNLGDMNYWSFTSSGSTWQIVNHYIDPGHSSSKIYLDPARPTSGGNNILIFHTEGSGTPDGVNVVDAGSGKWKFYRRYSGSDRYITGNGTSSSSFARGSSSGAGSYIIYKQIKNGTRMTETGYEVDVYISAQGSTETPVLAKTVTIDAGTYKTVADIVVEIEMEGTVTSSEYKKDADSTEKTENVSKLESTESGTNLYIYAEAVLPEDTVTGNDPRALYLTYRPPVTYWEKVTTIEPGEEYVIVSSADNAFKLNSSRNGIEAFSAVFTPVSGKDNLYSTPAKPENTSKWTIASSGGNWTVKNNSSSGSSNYYLYPSYNGTLINSSSGNIRFNQSSSGWTISRNAYGSTYYYVRGTGASGSGFDTTANSGSAGNYTIYKPYTGGTRKTSTGYTIDVYVKEEDSTGDPELKGTVSISEGTQKTIAQICTSLGITEKIVGADYKLSAASEEKIEHVSRFETISKSNAMSLDIYADASEPEETITGNDPRALYLTYRPEVTYWEKVTTIEPGEEYVIVSSADNAFKLNSSRNGIEALPAIFTPVSGTDNLYSTPAKLENTSKWTIASSGGNWTVKNNSSSGSSNYYLYPSNNGSLIGSSNNGIRITSSSSGWMISRSAYTSTTYYVSGTGTPASAFGTTTTYGNAGHYAIYKPYVGGTRKTSDGYEVAVYVSRDGSSDPPVLVKSVKLDAGTQKNIAEIATEVGIDGIIANASYHDLEGTPTGYIPGVKELIVLEDGSILNIIASDTIESVSGTDKRALFITYTPLEYDRYPAIHQVSGEKTIATSLGEVNGTAYSDPSTSDIETEYRKGNPSETSPGSGEIKHNGRVRTDKSVVYMGDDYDAFSYYEPNTFGVTLSALAQGYDLYADLTVTSPTDVVLVLDCSSSMIYDQTLEKRVDRAKKAVEAINSTIDKLMETPGNRVGLVLFSSYGHEFLPLDRYTTSTKGQYISFDHSGTNDYIATIKTVSGLRNSDGHIVSNTYTGDYRSSSSSPYQWGGTYTQSGIAMGSDLLGAAPDKVYVDTKTLEYPDGSTEDVKFSITRTPVLMLVTDGIPTGYTLDWNDVDYNHTYDDSHYDTSTGMPGYYVVKTAKYYVDKIRISYGKMPVYFTLGFGDFGDSNQNTTKYARAVLNPTSVNIEAVNKTVGLGQKFYQLMDEDENYPSNHDYYDCTTEAFIEGESTVSDITKFLLNCVTSTTTMRVYGILLKNTTGVKVTDPIGAGMEVKGAPKLIYGYGITGYGIPLEPTSVTAEGNRTVYHYSFEYADPHGSGFVIHSDNTITATVETDANGLQTVIFNVPYESMPLYNRVIGYGNIPTDYFYEQLPLRLIYQVGLTEESETKIKTTAGKKTYYTNRFVDENNPASYCLYVPTNKNPFYNHIETTEYETPQYTEFGVPKDSNTTQTANESWKTGKDVGTGESVIDYRDSLGNNGKLVFDGAVPGIEIPVEKEWIKASDPEKQEVLIGLYTVEGSGSLEHFEPVKNYLGNPTTVKLSQKNSWTDSFSVAAPSSGKPYYLMELNVLTGFTTEYRTGGEIAATRTIGTNTAALASDNTGQPIPITVRNIKLGGASLPSTGGCGREIIYILGILLIAAGVTGLAVRKNKRKRRPG